MQNSVIKKLTWGNFDILDKFEPDSLKSVDHLVTFLYGSMARAYLQLPLRQWGAGNVYLLLLSSWKVNIAEKPHCRNGVVDTFELYCSHTIINDNRLHRHSQATI